MAKSDGTQQHPVSSFIKRYHLDLITAIAALVVSAVTLYVTYVAPPKLHIAVSEEVTVGFDSSIPDHTAVARLFVVIGNSGAKMFTLQRTALLVRTAGKEKPYLMTADGYLALAPAPAANGVTVDPVISAPVPLQIPPGPGITEHIGMRAMVGDSDVWECPGGGTFDVTLLGWDTGEKDPYELGRFQLKLSSAECAVLHTYRTQPTGPDERNLMTVNQVSWQAWQAHALSTQDENHIQKNPGWLAGP